MPENLKMTDERAAELREQLAKITGEWRPQFSSAVADLLDDRETLTAENERLTRERDEARSENKRKAEWLATVRCERDDHLTELARLNDLDILRLQLPDGSVPESIEAGVRGWKRAYEETRKERDAAHEEVAVLRSRLNGTTFSIDVFNPERIAVADTRTD